MMNTHADKPQDTKTQSTTKDTVQKQTKGLSKLVFNDNRPEKSFQLKTQAMANEAIQRKENKTGMPDQLKSGIESLSGMDMSDVRVHYNSSRPAQLQAHAYAQGNQIHLGSGQERHLPHEAWHVVQQKQGRVHPTTQLMGKVNINDDTGLEKEADVMGAKALQMKQTSFPMALSNLNSNESDTVQRYKFTHNSDTPDENISTYAQLLTKCAAFTDFPKFNGAFTDANDFKDAVMASFNYHGLLAYKAILKTDLEKEQKRQKVISDVKQWKAEAAAVNVALHGEFTSKINAEIATDAFLTLYEEDATGKMSKEQTEDVLTSLLYYFVKDKLDAQREIKQASRLVTTKSKISGKGFSEKQQNWLEEHKSDFYIDENSGTHNLEIYKGGAITDGKLKKTGVVDIKSYIDKQIKKDAPIYPIEQEIKKLEERVGKLTEEENVLKVALTQKIIKLKDAINLTYPASEWMFERKSNVKLSMADINKDDKLDGFNLVMNYSGKTITGKLAIEAYIKKQIIIDGKTINLNRVPLPDKSEVATHFFKPFGNEDRVAADIINHPTTGDTGFTVGGEKVYHSSDGSGSTNDMGTVFWVYNVGTKVVTIIAQGKHSGSGYSVSSKLDGVTVTSVKQQPIVILNDASNFLSGSYK